MRDYPAFPNVFRVASAFSVNNENAVAAQSIVSGRVSSGRVVSEGVENTKNSNMLSSSSVGQSGSSNRQQLHQQQLQELQEQQQQQQKQHQQQQQLRHQLVVQQHHTQQMVEKSTTSETMPTTNRSLSNNKPNNNIINNNSTNGNSANGNSTFTRSSQLSQHATKTNSVCITSSQQQQQQKLQHQQNNINYHHQTMNNQHQNHQSSNGVINTISGSIPATGFKTNRQSFPMANDPVGDSTSCRNSCTELNGFPGVDSATHERLRCVAIDQQSREKVTKFNEHQRRGGLKTEQRTNSGGASGGSYLWIVTPVAASISVAIVIAALAGPQWLYTEEKLPNVNYNGTANFNALDDGAFITKYTKSSLWILCTTMQGVETYNCIKIDYFPKEGYQPDPLDSTPAIPYTVTKSCPYFLASGLFLLISFIVFLVPTCSHQNNLFYFSAGIMFIVSGLLMLIGLIAYISILKAEIGSKLRPRSTLQPPLFKVTYGQSFFLFVFGFMATEFVGLLNIFLYISLQEVGYYSRLPCLTITNIQQKIKEGENPRSHNYKNFKHPQITPQFSGQTTCLNQHPVQQEVGQEMLQKLPAFTCKKHPRSNILLTNDLERRYFFEKPPKCDLHSKNLARSLNELYTEPAPPLAPPPPPFQNISGTTPHSSQTLPRQTTQFADLPHEFPLTRSISTTTELCSSNSSGNAINGSGNATVKDECNQSSAAAAATASSRAEQKNRRNQATNTRLNETNETAVRSIASVGLENGARRPSNDDDDATNNNDADTSTADVYDEEPQQRFCGLKRGIRRTKDELFTEFCRKAGVRPKPKNIYYIDKDEVGDEQRESGEKRSRRCNEIAGSGNRTTFMADQEEDDEVTDENIYFIDDRHHQQMHHQHPVRNQRRSSMFLEPPPALRKLNSNISLHSLYPPEKNYQKSLFDLDRCDSNNADMWHQWHHPQSSYHRAASYGGSQNRLHHLNYNNQLHQSRTLPRTFFKRNCDSQDSLSQGFQRGSTNTLNDTTYSSSQNRLATFMLQQQQLQQLQQHQQQRYLSLSRDGNIYHSGLALHKSCDDIANNYHQPATSFETYVSMRPQHLTVASNNVTSQQQQQHTVHWPTAIPTSPSNFATKSYIYAPDSAAVAAATASQQAQVSHLQQLQQQHALVTRSVSSGAAAPSHKFQRSYAFDGQRRASAVQGEAFDLDEIERERRRSHASLFGGGGGGGGGISAEQQHYDMINGTAV